MLEPNFLKFPNQLSKIFCTTVFFCSSNLFFVPFATASNFINGPKVSECDLFLPDSPVEIKGTPCTVWKGNINLTKFLAEKNLNIQNFPSKIIQQNLNIPNAHQSLIISDAGIVIHLQNKVDGHYPLLDKNLATAITIHNQKNFGLLIKIPDGKGSFRIIYCPPNQPTRVEKEVVPLTDIKKIEVYILKSQQLPIIIN